MVKKMTVTDKALLEKLEMTLEAIATDQALIENAGQNVVEILLMAVNTILQETCLHYYQTGSLSPTAIDPPESACRLGRNPDTCYSCDLYDNEKLRERD